MEEDRGFRIARIVDMVSHKDYDTVLLGSVVNSALQANVHAIDFLHSGAYYNEALKVSGFFDTAGTEFAEFPILFSPLSRAKTFINVANDFDAPLDNCFITKADADRDRPTTMQVI